MKKKSRAVVSVPEPTTWQLRVPLEGQDGRRPGRWAFALDLNGTGFTRVSCSTVHWLCSVFIKFSAWKCDVVYFSVWFWFGFFLFFTCKVHLCFPWFLPFSLLYCNFLSFVLL